MTATRDGAADPTRPDVSTGSRELTRPFQRPGRVSAWFCRHDLLLYFLLAFLLSWLPWPLVVLNRDSSPMVPFGPLVAALVAAAVAGGRRAVTGLLGQLTRWRRPVRWYLVALLVPVTISGVAAVLTNAVGDPAIVTSGPDWLQVVVTFVSTLVLIGVFEEVGWRGYALPRLQHTMSGLRAALVLGVIWASWHLPELVSDPTRQRPAVQFVIMVVAQSVFLTWLYNSTAGGLPIVMLSHAAIDTVLRFILPAFDQDSYQTVWWCQAGLWAAAAVLVTTMSRSRRAVGHPRSAGCLDVPCETGQFVAGPHLQGSTDQATRQPGQRT